MPVSASKTGNIGCTKLHPPCRRSGIKSYMGLALLSDKVLKYPTSLCEAVGNRLAAGLIDAEHGWARREALHEEHVR